MTITIITSGASDETRTLTAFGHIMRLGMDATADQVKARVEQWISDSVMADESRQAVAALTQPSIVSFA